MELAGVDLRRTYGARPVVDGVTLVVRSGEVLAVLGPNGAGKSTLFRLLSLVEPPDAGRIEMDGRPVTWRDTAAVRRIGAVFQRPYLFRGTIESNVAYALRVRDVQPVEQRTRVAEALELLGLGGRGPEDVARLSGGEAQRVALARALVARPEVLLLDEPTANLDVTVRRRFREDMERIVRRSAGAVVLITHDPSDAFTFADRIAIMEDGRIVQQDTPTDLVLNPRTPFVAAFTGAELLLDGTVADLDAELVTVRVGTATVVAAARATGMNPGDRAHIAYRPEDVLITLPGDAPPSSAINRFPATVGALVPADSLVRLRLDGDIPLTGLVTRRSAEALGLNAGTRVVAQLKATALRAFPSAQEP